jgi:3-methyl-2-oxobutanoate hydroxymethyltransferase
MQNKFRVPDVFKFQSEGRAITALTAYDYSSARIVDQSGADIILVGDSLGTVVQGHETTLAVTIDEMIYHSRIVSRAINRALLLVDMPFMSYQSGVRDALISAGRLVKEGGAEAVKLEGAGPTLKSIEGIVGAGIPVMGHLGLTPQSVNAMGGYRVQGRSEEAAKRLLSDAKDLEQAGVFSIVLEGIPGDLAKSVSETIGIPTIGIGAGRHCNGQILVLHDILGQPAREGQAPPKFVKQYANIEKEMKRAISDYVDEVQNGIFPGKEHTY